MIYYKAKHLKFINFHMTDFNPYHFDQLNEKELFAVLYNCYDPIGAYFYNRQGLIWNILRKQFLESML